jgi:hypothetical protein
MRPLALTRWTLLSLLLATAPGAARASAAPTDSADAVAVVEEYHEALRRNAPDRVRAALGSSFMMFNGAHSGDPRDWEAHMYLAGADLDAWPARFVSGSGPHETTVRVVRVHLRRDAALVVTEESGRNRFRRWEGELATYLLGREGGRWRIVGYFIRDIANPT